MKRRWLVGGGVLVVVAVAAASVVWYVSRDDEGALAATLQDMQYESTDQYAFPGWWTDGSSAMRITGSGDALRVDEPLAQYDYTGHDDLRTELAAADGTKPAAVAALPGDPAAGWVAIAFPPEEKGGDDASSTQRPLTWTGRVPARDSPPAQAVELPVALHNVTSSADIKAASAVVARFDDTEMAIALTSQADSFSLQICSIGDCQWSERPMPDGLAIESLASTGDGVVAITADDAAVWYADDAALTWKKIGSAPTGMRLQAMRDGDGQVAIVWKARGDDDVVSLAIQTVSDGGVRNEVDRMPVEGELDRLYGVVEYDGRWYVGGARPSTARISIAYDAKEAVLWQQGEKSWAAVDDELLRNQPDQEIEALYIDHDGHLRAISNSPVQRGTLLWKFSREER